eukprot:g25648.t1
MWSVNHETTSWFQFFDFGSDHPTFSQEVDPQQFTKHGHLRPHWARGCRLGMAIFEVLSHYLTSGRLTPLPPKPLHFLRKEQRWPVRCPGHFRRSTGVPQGPLGTPELPFCLDSSQAIVLGIFLCLGRFSL